MSTAAEFSEPVVVPCPNCEQQLKVPADRIGVRCRCSACKSVLTPHAPVDSDEPSPEDDDFVLLDEQSLPQGTGDSFSMIETEAADSFDEILDADDVIVWTSPPSGYARRPSGLSMRAKRWIAWAFLRFALGVFFIFVGAMVPFVGCFGLLLIFWYWPARALEPYVTAALFPTLHCPGCGFEFDAVGRWTVGSYTDHRERHIAHAKDRIHGGEVIGHTDCPQCGATLLV